MAGFFMAISSSYTKNALSLDDQVSHLRARGLIVNDDSAAKQALRRIGFFRFAGYGLHWRLASDGTKANFKDGTHFEHILEVADFDRRIRTFLMEAIERIEVAVRSAITNSIAVEHGPFWFTDKSLFSTTNPKFDHAKLISHIEYELSLRKPDEQESFIRLYLSKTTNPRTPPSWMTLEVLRLGTVSRIIENLNSKNQKLLSRELNLGAPILVSWMHSLTVLRNFCAHHARLWNRSFSVNPMIPKLYEPHFRVISVNKSGGEINEIQNRTLYAHIFMVFKFLEATGDGSQWIDRLFDLLHEHKSIEKSAMGFPEEWTGYPTEQEMEEIRKMERKNKKLSI